MKTTNISPAFAPPLSLQKLQVQKTTAVGPLENEVADFTATLVHYTSINNHHLPFNNII